MKISLVLVLLFAATLSTSVMLFPMKPAAAQTFDFEFILIQDPECVGIEILCSSSQGLDISLFGSPLT